jgi:hypothetical protein
MSDLHGEASRAFERLGGDPIAVDAAFNVMGLPGVKVDGVTVGRPIAETFDDRVIRDQISGTETVIGRNGRRPDASISVVLDASGITAVHKAARLAELKAQRAKELSQ